MKESEESEESEMSFQDSEAGSRMSKINQPARVLFSDLSALQPGRRVPLTLMADNSKLIAESWWSSNLKYHTIDPRLQSALLLCMEASELKTFRLVS